MTGPGPDKRNSVMVYDSISGRMNHRDASNTATARWRNPPTAISIPGSSASEHVQRHSARPHDNPYFRSPNTLSSQPRRPGNPNVRQTVLAKPKLTDGSSFGADSHARKRQKLDTSISSAIASNGASSSYARGLAPRNSVSEPDIQVIEPPRATNNRNHPVQNDAEIIDLEVSSSDLGERVPRAVKSSSPDPILIGPNGVRKDVHIFETYPTKYSSSASNKGKGRAKELPERVEGSEEDESIEEYTPTSRKARPPSNAKESREIPMDIVPQRREYWENFSASAPAASYQPIEKVVNSVDLTSGSVISKMKRKDEGPLGHQKSAGVSDSVGTSSSNFLNSTREKEKTQTLPLKAWCLGQHLFQHSESAPLKLVYEVTLHRIRVTWGRSPPEKLEFKLDRDVCSAMVIYRKRLRRTIERKCRNSI
ncbi:hypothetical protein OG21DRAFT_1027325 [Imleria badia]|nr:hypothetical protein OG21DRAFT_1027325 [Imleria badia]